VSGFFSDFSDLKIFQPLDISKICTFKIGLSD
jgi:hypothetical protein